MRLGQRVEFDGFSKQVERGVITKGRHKFWGRWGYMVRVRGWQYWVPASKVRALTH